MLSAEESAELRSLQIKAYGPGGGLSTVELERLQGLERLRLPSVAQPDSSRSARSTPGDGLPGQAPGPRQPDSPQESGPRQESDAWADLTRDVERAEGETKRVERAERVEASDEPPADADSLPRRQRRHPFFKILGAAVLALVLGIGVGWLVFGRDAGPAIPVTAEQQVRGEQLAEDANFDAGTLTPMLEADGVLVWMGTRDDGNITCLIVEDGERDAPSCGQTESIRNGGLYGMLSRDAPTETAENGVEMISVSLGFGQDGKPVVMLQRGWTESNNNYLDQFTDPEQRSTAERLLDDGLDEWSPMLAAYDGDTPIWVGTRDAGEQVCLFYGGEPDGPSACASIETAQTTGVGLSVLSWTDDDPSGVSLLLRYTDQMMPSIVISPVGSASDVKIDPETGDPIEFTFDDPTFGDLPADGETGETGG